MEITFLLMILTFGYLINHTVSWIWHIIKNFIIGDVYVNSDVGKEKQIDIFSRPIYRFILSLPSKINDSISGIAYGSLILISIFEFTDYVLYKCHNVLIIHGMYINNSYFIKLFKRILVWLVQHI